MDANHQRQHLKDLRGRLHFLRTLVPESDRYKLWLGDLVEFVNVAYGPASDEMARLRAVITAHTRLRTAGTDTDHVMRYLQRLDALDALLEEFERAIRSPIVFFDGR